MNGKCIYIFGINITGKSLVCLRMKILQIRSLHDRDCAYLLININEASPLTGNMLVVFILNQPCKICQETPTKNCRDCAYLLININEASPRTGNMLVVFILNQPCKTAHLQTVYICKPFTSFHLGHYYCRLLGLTPYPPLTKCSLFTMYCLHDFYFKMNIREVPPDTKRRGGVSSQHLVDPKFRIFFLIL